MRLCAQPGSSIGSILDCVAWPLSSFSLRKTLGEKTDRARQLEHSPEGLTTQCATVSERELGAAWERRGAAGRGQDTCRGGEKREHTSWNGPRVSGKARADCMLGIMVNMVES